MSWRLYVKFIIPECGEWVGATHFSRDLCDVPVAFRTVRILLISWRVVHVVLGGHPEQETGELRVDGRVVGALA